MVIVSSLSSFFITEGPVVPFLDLTSPKILGLENWKSPGIMETLVLCEASVENLGKRDARWQNLGSVSSLTPPLVIVGAERAKNWIKLQGRDLPNSQTSK